MALALTCTVFFSRVVGPSGCWEAFCAKGAKNKTHFKATTDFVVELPGGQFYVSVKCKGGNSVGNRLI